MPHELGITAVQKKDGREMLIAIVLDKPLSEAQALLDDPDAFMLEITKIIQNKHAHPVIAQMLHPDVRDDLPPSECPTASSEGQSSHTATTNRTQPQKQFQSVPIYALPSTWDTHGRWSNIQCKLVFFVVSARCLSAGRT